MSQDRSIRGKIAVAGVGETPYYKHGESPEPEFKMALEAILNAGADADLPYTLAHWRVIDSS